MIWNLSDMKLSMSPEKIAEGRMRVIKMISSHTTSKTALRQLLGNTMCVHAFVQPHCSFNTSQLSADEPTGIR